MMIWDLNVAVLYGRFLSYRGGLYNRFDCITYLHTIANYRFFSPVNQGLLYSFYIFYLQLRNKVHGINIFSSTFYIGYDTMDPKVRFSVLSLQL